MRGYAATENTMESWDGTKLFYRAWIPERQPNKAVLLFHRGHEHSARLIDLVDQLNLGEDFAYFAWDARGNGKSPGERDYAETFSVYARDADCFASHISEKYKIEISRMALIANSVGAVIACSWVHDYAPPIKALVMAAPAFRIKLYIPFAIPLLRLAQKLRLMNKVTSYVKAFVLTHDKKEQRSFNEDPLITRSIATNILLDVHDTGTRMIEDAGAIRIPIQMHVAGSDWVVQVAPQKKFFDRLESTVREWHYYPEFYHAIYHEIGREKVLESTRLFISRVFAMQERKSSLLDADRNGYTRREYDRLNLPAGNPVYLLNRWLLRSLGRLSDGIRLGLKEGFDSGVTLDYVYKNSPGGITSLGRLIDTFYLNSIGWRGIRQRKINLEKLLRSAILRIQGEGRRVEIVDIAAGPGRYVLEAIREFPPESISATLRDYKQVNIEDGRRMAEKMALRNVRFQQGDAFDKDSLATLSPRPTLAIVSGLYELYADNEPVMRSLRGLVEAMDVGGYLLYTNQPWHPQVEYIARVLPNREGRPWIMRRRTQEEMDELVETAGFTKMAMEIDQWGIFTVSLARKLR